jgi:hypothetical protein
MATFIWISVFGLMTAGCLGERARGVARTQTLVINLPEDVQRREHSQALLKSLGLDAQIIEAIRPNASFARKQREQGM